jgi:DNA topoisomerase I
VNEYLRDITGEEITAKDFRTWAATNLAALALQRLEAFDSQAKARKTFCRPSKRLPRCWATRSGEELADPGHGLRAEEAAVIGFLAHQLQDEAAGGKVITTAGR